MNELKLKDECEYCGRKEEDHRVNGAGKYCCMPFDYNLSYPTFKSTTQGLAERNAVRNLELLMQVHHLLNEKITSSFLDSQDMIELENMVEQLYIAIKQSTECQK